MSQSKPHLAIRPEPTVHEGSDVECLCGEALKAVKIAGFSDVTIVGRKFLEICSSLTTCPHCLRTAETLSTERPQDVQFIYWLVSRDSKLGQRLERAGESTD